MPVTGREEEHLVDKMLPSNKYDRKKKVNQWEGDNGSKSGPNCGKKRKLASAASSQSSYLSNTNTTGAVGGKASKCTTPESCHKVL